MTNDIFLSPHFKLSEFVVSETASRHGIDNTPPEEAVENLRRLCQGIHSQRERLLRSCQTVMQLHTASIVEIPMVISSRTSSSMRTVSRDVSIGTLFCVAQARIRTPSP